MNLKEFKVVRFRICELLKGSTLDPMRLTERAWTPDLPSPIEEAEVLAAMRACGSHWTINNRGQFIRLDLVKDVFYRIDIHWEMGRSLGAQKGEVVRFVGRVLIGGEKTRGEHKDDSSIH